MASRLSAADQARLRYVRAEAGTDLSDFPDFLIIGPQRTGTTWLHANLRAHPEIMLSEPKEIFYFSRLKPPHDRKQVSADLEWYLNFFREPAWRRGAKALQCLWRFGELYRPKVRGEATASYAAVDADVIDEIVALRPGVKVILTVRDPVERAWSHAKKDLARQHGRRVADVDDAELVRFFEDEYQLRCARYADIYANWRARLRPKHLFVGLFDDIARRPVDLLLDVMRFLGVRQDRRYIGSDAERAINPTAGDRIPTHHKRTLEELLGSERARLHEVEGLRTSGVR
jgi:hypothetical protein